MGRRGLMGQMGRMRLVHTDIRPIGLIRRIRPISHPTPSPLIRMDPGLAILALQQSGGCRIIDNLFRLRVPLDS